MAIITVWSSTIKHQYLDLIEMVIAPLNVSDFPTIDLCKKFPFHFRKKKTAVPSCNEVIYVLQRKGELLCFGSFCWSLSDATFRCFLFFFSRIYNKKTLHTFYNLFNTRKMVHITCCFQCPSAVVEKWQK